MLQKGTGCIKEIFVKFFLTRGIYAVGMIRLG